MSRSLPDNYWRKKSMPETDPEEVIERINKKFDRRLKS